MGKCKKCGVSRIPGQRIEWTSDGTILARDISRTRLVFLEVDEIRNIFSGISERIGFSIDPIVLRAEKEVGWRLWETLIPSIVTRIPRTRITRPEWFAKLLVHIMADFVAPAGMGDVRVESYRSGKSATYRIFNAHSVPLFAGASAGAFEYIERVEADSHWDEVGEDEVVVTVETVGDAPHPDQRLVFESRDYLPGIVEFERCQQHQLPQLKELPSPPNPVFPP